MKFLALKIPPLLILVIIAGLMWLVSISAEPYTLNIKYKLILLIGSVVIALIIMVISAYSFKKVQTTVNPIQPNNSSALVTSGIYRFTRNPMYISFTLILIGWAVFLSAWQSFLFIPLFILYINYLQIIPEEKALVKIFGQTYINYKKKVRRWI